MPSRPAAPSRVPLVSVFVAFVLALTPQTLRAQINQYRVQPEVWSFARSSSPGVDAYGDLSLSVPVFNVPGRGMDFPISFGYRSGISVSQRPSWVGLGWSFDPGSFSREPEGGLPNGTHYYGVDLLDNPAAPPSQPDVYYLSLPGHGTVEVYQYRPNAAGAAFPVTTLPAYAPGDFVVAERRAWKITPLDTSATTAGRTTGEMVQGGTFVAKPDYTGFVVTVEDGTRYVFARPTVGYFDTIRSDHKVVRQVYANTWRLVAVLGTTFGAALPSSFDTPWPSDGTAGNWVRFEYGAVATATGPETNLFDLMDRVVQTLYLTKIATPTHTATFNTMTYRGPKPLYATWESPIYKRLTSVELWVRGGTAVLEEVALTQNTTAMTPTGFNGATTSGRLRLDAVRYFGRGGQATGPERPGYSFSYEFNPTGTAESLGPWADDFGYYNAGLQGGAGSDPNGDAGGGAWSLTGVTHPTGGETIITYETDRVPPTTVPYTIHGIGSTFYYADSGWRMRQGGARVKTVEDVEYPFSTLGMTTYTYGDGLMTGVPAGNWTRNPQYPLRFFSPSSRGKVAVLYPWVRATRGTGTYTETRYAGHSSGHPVDPIETVSWRSGTFSAEGQACSEHETSNVCEELVIVQGNQHWDWGYKIREETWINGHRDRLETLNHTPQKWDLMTSWTATHYAGQPAFSFPVHVEFGQAPLTGKNVDENGIITANYFNYDARTLQLSQVREEGHLGYRYDKLTTDYEFAHDLYPGMRDKNMLSQVRRTARSRRAGNEAPVVYGAEVTTWENFTSGGWKPWRSLAWSGKTSTSSSFTEWSTETVPTGWVETRRNEAYDDNGNLLLYRDGRGYYTQLYYGSNGSPFSFTSGSYGALLTGARRVYRRDLVDPEMPWPYTGTNDLTLSIQYDTERYLPTKTTTEEGVTTSYAYDPFGRLSDVKDNAGQLLAEHAYHYGPNYVRSTAHLSGSLAVTTTAYADGLGRPYQTQTQSGTNDIVTQTDYDALGLPYRTWKPILTNTGHAALDPATFRTQALAYYDGSPGPNASGRPFVETLRGQASGTSAIQMVRPEGVSGTAGATRTEPCTGAGSTLNYKGLCTYDGDGKRTDETFDIFGRRATQSTGTGTTALTTYFEYDYLGNPSKVKAPNGLETLTTHNALGQLTWKKTPDAGETRYRYDAAGNLRFWQDARQAVNGDYYFTTYDFANRPLTYGEEIIPQYGTEYKTFMGADSSFVNGFEAAPMKRIRETAYDAKPSTSAAPWNTYASAISGTTMSNLKGKESAVWYRGTLTLYSYDARGRVGTRKFWSAPTAPAVTTSYTYDRQGNLTEAVASLGSTSFRQRYVYNALGQLVTITGSPTTTYPTTPDVTYTYTPAGEVATVQYGQMAAVPYKHTARGQVAEIGAIGSPGVFAARYTYNNNGTVQAAEFHQNGSPHPDARYKYAYSYDFANRLTGADYSHDHNNDGAYSASSQFDLSNVAYDKVGNLTGLYRQLPDYGYHYYGYRYVAGTNRLDYVMDEVDYGLQYEFAYDPLGNVRQMTAPGGSSTTSTYDERNLPTTVTEGAATYTYKYTADGQRFYAAVNANAADTDVYVVDGARTFGVFSATSALRHWNLLTPSGRAVGRYEPTGNTRKYYHADPLGTPRAVVTAGGTVTERADYYPFGLEMPGRAYVQGTPTRENFTGHEKDTETGLLYAGARYYMPALGRFTSVDPHAASYPGWSPYSYALNNPLSNTDPDGKDVVCQSEAACERAVSDIQQLYEGAPVSVKEYQVTTRRTLFGWTIPGTEKTRTEYRVVADGESDFDWGQDKYASALYDAISSEDVTFNLSYSRTADVGNQRDVDLQRAGGGIFDAISSREANITIDPRGDQRVGIPSSVLLMHEMVGHGHPVATPSPPGRNNAHDVNRFYQERLGISPRAPYRNPHRGYQGEIVWPRINLFGR